MSDLDPEEFRRLGHAVVDWVAGYRAGIGEHPVRAQVEPGWVRERMPALPEQPQPFDALLAELDRVVVPATTHWQAPGFFGYFPANASLHSVLGDLLSGGLGVQGMLWSTSPAATEVEQVLLDGLADALGLDPAYTWAGGGGGTIADSASSAALVALLAALHRTSGGAWRERGVDGTERVYVTAETHSSLAKAVRVAGLGAAALRIVPPSPGSLAMSAQAFAEMAAEDVAAGLRPVLVCPTIGTTGTGAVDPVREIALAAREHGTPGREIWVHVDAAWAGVAALCPEHRDVIDGVELADSFCTDAHKWLLTAFDASLLWVRDAAALPAALSITPEYLRNSATDSGEVVDYRDWQVPLGRRFRALKLWSVLHGFGLEGVRAHLRGHVALAAELESWIVAEPGFELAVPRSLSLVCLRLSAGDEATRALLERVNATGRVLLTHTVVDGRYVIRVAIGSVATEREHVEELWGLLTSR
ncbi:pyridoxal-dependent decarboxylase [Pseudonocardia broussonetiae]|uniref:Aspartate aminotransferase family protein n=1 Tax=Pseudonocardia broussonetiae TaxID=2736640 RepID=A0A6M6JPH8_9PSEU|nr:pyridoxal-dependent decarboxylase [Pseudonocardia broussonetiae]QJY48339.1 aspartate aminotransferase family protein [Pseudonocardia broussonetiae]